MEVDCSFCLMPVLSKDVEEILFLYQRCREWNVLPYKGGLVDQPEELMQIFDVILEETAKHKKREIESRELEMGHRQIGGFSHGG